jgi:hypothetical protein
LHLPTPDGGFTVIGRVCNAPAMAALVRLMPRREDRAENVQQCRIGVCYDTAPRDNDD